MVRVKEWGFLIHPVSGLWCFAQSEVTFHATDGKCLLEPTGGVEDYKPPPDFDGPQIFELTRRWFDDCVQNHSKCNALPVSSWLPTRILDLTSLANENKVKLVIPKEGDIIGLYSTLSHRWGEAETLKLTAETME